jgi:hypothetical protein
MSQSSSNQNTPTAWTRFESVHRKQSYITERGFSCDFAHLSRWAARFRLAKSFQGLDLGNEYTSTKTPIIYSAIVKIFLVYSAFELYCSAIGLNASDETLVKSIQDTQGQRDIILKIRNHDPQNHLFKFLLDHLTGRSLKNTMQKFIEGEYVNVSFLAKCVRHIFAHGFLAANSSGLSIESFAEISRIISIFLLDCMDNDFESKIN